MRVKVHHTSVFFGLFLAEKKNLNFGRDSVCHRAAGRALSGAIAGAACLHEMVRMVAPDPPCVCAGILTLRVFLHSFLAGPLALIGTIPCRQRGTGL